MLRREVLKMLAALAALPTRAFAADAPLQVGPSPVPFNAQTVPNRARALAAVDYAPRPAIPKEWQDISYDQYRKIWFDTRNALWENTARPQRLDVFPPGLYYPQGIEINIIEDSAASPLLFDMAVFDSTDKFPDLPLNENMGYSGLRLRADLLNSGIYTEYNVFQGASYFRGIGTGEIYGLSARGLALKTGDPMGEEFPEFTAFWIETPEPSDKSVTIHALMDSPSCTGAFRFEITHGKVLDMEVEATIFARTELSHVGIAPLTSMFLFDAKDRARFSDFRPNVHDSDGLLIHNGWGEVIWRPLANPTTLQISAFGDQSPKGFGLMQRKREFSDYNDLEALYHMRPSVWITPRGDWGEGAVTLVEIPADLEIYDNIVAYWRPTAPIAQGAEQLLRYNLQWGADPAPNPPELLRVTGTAIGGRPEGGLVMVIDFDQGEALPEDLSMVEVTLRSSTGTTTPGILQRNPETNGPRLAFTFMPEGADSSEFRVQLRIGDAPLSEVWLYRWTKT
ncbi:glucan biosynthesis protein [Sulfitobacter guttiformis]|uniref:Glucans biosynthesis protein n=1 Tax=Sulfitobacter guttiformis TaxID=74349 RepID=A0A420DUJ8_9RHOB|nr:glucan biosynthesis protein G [Sulfitobacter guttiformis]KIN71418.1 Glucans biosynthesis protein G [Sulfitobacter guttiformis KCTC 32187]RKE97863.1 glucans biosynthesis protein [Sulfitobacter guttiformis]